MIDDFSIDNITNEEQKTLAHSKVLIAGQGAFGDLIKKNLLDHGVKIIETIKETEIYNSEKLSNYDLILDCTTNYKSKFFINKVSQKYKMPFLYNLFTENSWQMSLIIPEQTPCLSCLFPDKSIENTVCKLPDTQITEKASLFVLSEISNTLLKRKTSTDNYLMNYYASSNEFQKIKLSKNVGCPICAKN